MSRSAQQASALRPRLLPATMAGLAALFAVKCIGLVGAAYGAAEPAPAPSQVSPAPPAVPAVSPVPWPASPAAAPATATAVPSLAPGSGPAPPPAEAMPGAAERSLLLDLRKRRIELDTRAAALDQRERLMGAAEKQFAARADELLSLQKRLEALEAARRDRDETSWRGLVRVYETMKPKDAAVIFNDLDGSVLLQVVDRMKDGKAAAVLAAMAPDRARRLTADLSLLRSRANAPPEAVALPQPGASRATPDASAQPLRPATPSAAAAPPGASP